MVTLTYAAASAGQTLNVTITLDSEYNASSGRISLDAAALIGAGPPSTFLPFSDDFTGGVSPDWIEVDETTKASNWHAQNGAYHQDNEVGLGSSVGYEEAYHLGTYSYLSTGMSLTDYKFTATLTPTAETGLAMGLMARYNGSDSFIRFTFGTWNGFARLETKSGSGFTALVENARGYPKNVPLTVSLEVQGPVIVARVNGEKLFGAYDASLTQGTVALFCRDACEFDDVSIQENSTTPEIVITEPTSYSVSTTTTFSVGAVVLNQPAGANVEFNITGEVSACTSATETNPGNFTANCTVPASSGSYELVADLLNSGLSIIDTDTNAQIGIGNNFVSVGDSITAGKSDNTVEDNISTSEWVLSSQGYEAILTDLLSLEPEPSIVHNNGVGGDKSSDLLNDRIPSVLTRHSEAGDVIVMIGTNDSGGTLFTPSGLGCSNSACNGTFKGNLQAVVNQINAAGKVALVALTPPKFGDQSTSTPYSNPGTHTKNLLISNGYNEVIRTELTGHIIGPDTYNYFLETDNRFYLFADNLHPNALGYIALAHLMANSITGGSTLPFMATGLCVTLSQGSSCEAPMLYKQNVMESGNTLFIDQTHTLTGNIPGVLNNGRWIITADAHADQTNTDYLAFDIPNSSSVYIAYDDAASSIPSWLSSAYIDTGLFVTTDNPSASSLRLYRADNVVGTLVLAGADASTNGAGSNYIVIVVED